MALPDDLNLDNTNSIQLFDYRRVHNIQKSKINLTKNVISFLRSGTKEVYGEDKIVQIEHQHFVMMKSGNCLMTEHVSNARNLYKSVLLFFSNEVILDFLERNDLYEPQRQANQSFYVFQYDNFIEDFVKSLEKILTFPKTMQQKLLMAKFDEIMLYLTYQHGITFLNSMIQKVGASTVRLTNIVENNKYNKLTLQELAFLSNMSVSTFKREFFKQYQTTPIKWFHEKRLEHIALLLRTKQTRPIDLYEAAGYENFSNFIQAFKKRYGVTPKQYQVQISS